MQLEDERLGLCQTRNIDLHEVFGQLDGKGAGKVYGSDMINFLSVHRIAISQR